MLLNRRLFSKGGQRCEKRDFAWPTSTLDERLALTIDLCSRSLQYREEAEAGSPANLMFDKRVVRGNTYAARILAADLSVTSDTLKSTATQS